MARLLFRLGCTAHRHRLAVVLVWLLVLLGAGAGGATFAGETSNTFAIPGQESTTALERIQQEFGAAGGATARVVMQAPAGRTLTTPENAAAVDELVGELAALPGVTAASDPLDPAAPVISADQRTAYSTVTYRDGAGEVTPEQQKALFDAVDGAAATGLTVEVTGEAPTVPPHVGARPRSSGSSSPWWSSRSRTGPSSSPA